MRVERPTPSRRTSGYVRGAPSRSHDWLAAGTPPIRMEIATVAHSMEVASCLETYGKASSASGPLCINRDVTLTFHPWAVEEPA